MTTSAIDFDGVWKEALEIYFEEFMLFFFPGAHAEIDWTRQPEFLDKELQGVTPKSEIGGQRVDKLVKVWLKNGAEAWVLAHVEVQSQHETEFAKRVYIYNHRLFDRFDRQVASFAILGDEGKAWKPSHYTYELWGTTVDFRFSVVKLQEYTSDWTTLEQHENPFATVVMAHLKAQETRQDATARKEWKWSLTRALYEKGYSREDIQRLYRFIDWVMQLPRELEDIYWQQVQSYEEEQQMAYVTYAERRGIEQGLEQGLEQGIEQAAQYYRKTLFEILQRWTNLTPEQHTDLAEKLQQVSEPADLSELSSLALATDELARFHARLDELLAQKQSEESIDTEK